MSIARRKERNACHTGKLWGGADQSILPYAYEYGKWIVAFLPLFVFITVLGSFIRCDGNPKLVMTATLVGSGINIFGDWFLVFPMKMGVTGAAIATVQFHMVLGQAQ